MLSGDVVPLLPASTAVGLDPNSPCALYREVMVPVKSFPLEQGGEACKQLSLILFGGNGCCSLQGASKPGEDSKQSLSCPMGLSADLPDACMAVEM